jgi:hypothetical protein
MNRPILLLGLILLVVFFSVWAGMAIEDSHCQAVLRDDADYSEKREALTFTLGFDEGVRCGLVAYSMDRNETDMPVITARAHYWYVAIHAIRQQREIESAAPPNKNPSIEIPGEGPFHRSLRQRAEKDREIESASPSGEENKK